MKKINQFKIFIISATVFIIFIIVGVSMQMERNVFVIRFLNDGASVIQRGFVNLSHGIGNFGAITIDLFDTFEENQRLRANMYNDALLRLELAIITEENARLRNATGITETLRDFETIPVTTIGRDMNQWHHFLTINRGALDDIEVGMAVLSSEGYLIGQVTETNEFSARVHLLKIDNPHQRVHAHILNIENAFGAIEGYDPDTGLIRMIQVSRDIEVEIGLAVVSSGLSGIYPSGLLIGYVVSYETNADGLTQTVFLKNDVNYNRLDFLFVVRRSLLR